MPEGDLRDLFAVVERSRAGGGGIGPLTAEDNADELAAKYGTLGRRVHHRQAEIPQPPAVRRARKMRERVRHRRGGPECRR